MSGGKNVTISPVTFADEKTKYFFVYQYFTGVGDTKATVESKKLELQNVYGMKILFFFYKFSGPRSMIGSADSRNQQLENVYDMKMFSFN